MLTSQLNHSIIGHYVDLSWFVQIKLSLALKLLCIHVCVHECVCVGVHMLACRKQVDIKCLSQIVSTLVFETIF